MKVVWRARWGRRTQTSTAPDMLRPLAIFEKYQSGVRRLIRSPHGTPGVAESTAIASRPGRASRPFCPTGKSLNSCPALPTKIFCFTRPPNQNYIHRCPVPLRGAFRERHGRRGGMRWTRQRLARDGIAGRIERSVSGYQASGREMLQRTAKSCGPDAPTLVSSSRSCVGPTGLRQNLIR